MAEFVDLKEFKEKVKAGQDTKELKIQKQFTIDVVKGIEETDEGLKVPFICSTGSVDRQDDTVDPDGWRLDNYKKNPVVLWVHDSRQPPVAKSLEIKVEDKKLKSTALFVTADLYPFGYMIGQMYAKGFLNAVSVGFDPIKYARVEDKDRPWGIDFLEQELLEYSCCPIPANPEALVEAKAAGVDTAPLLEWAVKVLDGEGIWVPKDQAEGIYKVLKEKKTIFTPLPADDEQTDKGLLSCYQAQIQVNKNRRY